MCVRADLGGVRVDVPDAQAAGRDQAPDGAGAAPEQAAARLDGHGHAAAVRRAASRVRPRRRPTRSQEDGRHLSFPHGTQSDDVRIVGQLLGADAAAVPQRRRAGPLLARLLQVPLRVVPGTVFLSTKINEKLIFRLTTLNKRDLSFIDMAANFQLLSFFS